MANVLKSVRLIIFMLIVIEAVSLDKCTDCIESQTKIKILNNLNKLKF